MNDFCGKFGDGEEILEHLLSPALENRRSLTLGQCCFNCLEGAGELHIAIMMNFAITQQIDGYTAGVDYPIYNTIPKGLAFTCADKGPGYYSDPETQCQVWHWCLPNGRKYSFLCPNGTVFNQVYRVCDWWFNVDCQAAPSFYNVNDDLYKNAMGNYI